MADTQVKREQAPRDVNYGLEVIEGDLPTSSAQRSPIEDLLSEVSQRADLAGKWVRIGSYKNGSAATAAANVIRKKHGKSAEVDGWTVRTSRLSEDESGQQRTGLFVKFTPDAVVPGKMDEHRQAQTNAKASKAPAPGSGTGAKADKPSK